MVAVPGQADTSSSRRAWHLSRVGSEDVPNCARTSLRNTELRQGRREAGQGWTED